jgi:hypothetical protein
MTMRGIREFADEQLGRLLVATNFSESDGTGTVTMGFLDSAGGLQGQRMPGQSWM